MPRVKEPRNCAQCGKQFYPLSEAIARGGGIYCGVSCARKAAPPRKVQYSEPHDKTCERCGLIFQTLHPSQRFCGTCGPLHEADWQKARSRSRWRNDPEYRAARERINQESRTKNKANWSIASQGFVKPAKSRHACPDCGCADVIGDATYCADCRIERQRAAWRKADHKPARMQHKMIHKRFSRGRARIAIIEHCWPVQHGLCLYCGKHLDRATLHLDHYYPASKGGLTEPSNYVLSCPQCNLAKGSLLPHEYLLKIRLAS